jgi:sigma54-dependent transcription regulator
MSFRIQTVLTRAGWFMKGMDLLLAAARALPARALLADGAKAEAVPTRKAAVTVKDLNIFYNRIGCKIGVVIDRPRFDRSKFC